MKGPTVQYDNRTRSPWLGLNNQVFSNNGDLSSGLNQVWLIAECLAENAADSPGRKISQLSKRNAQSMDDLLLY